MRRGIDNTPSAEHVANLKRLCETALEPLRGAIGCPLVVSSGLRLPALNAAVGGALASDHLDGRAADVHAPGFAGGDVYALAETFLIRANSTLPGVAQIDFEQLIVEGSWLHISIARLGFAGRKQVLTARFLPGRKTQYLRGLVR